MGLLDSMFGGGTRLELALDADEVPEGGIVSGRVTLTGGKKPLTLTSLNVRLIYVRVETKEGSSIPDVESRVLHDVSIAGGVELPPGESQEHAFEFTIPPGTEPTAHNVSYQVVAAADIPKVKDPTATAKLKVMAAQARGFFGFKKGAEAIGGDELFARYPGLRSSDEGELVEAMRELMLAAYDKENNLVAAEPILARHLRGGSIEVRRGALEAWGNVLNGHARPEHLRTLEALIDDADTDEELLEEAVKIAAKFAEEGGLALVQKLSRDRRPQVRRALAMALYLDADRDVKGRRDLLLSMRGDADEGVRAAVFTAFAVLNKDREAMQIVATQLQRDPSPDVQKACVGALALAHHHGMAELVYATYEGALGNPHDVVRRELTQKLHWLPAGPRLSQLVTSLMRDPSDEVREAMAWQFCNMSEHPELRPLIERAAEGDASAEVRYNAIAGLASVVPAAELVPYYRARLKSDPSERMHWAVLGGARQRKDEAPARKLLEELARAPLPSVASAARDAISS